MQIGKVIRVLRKERDLSLESLAFDAATDASNLSRIERGMQQPTEEGLQAIANQNGGRFVIGLVRGGAAAAQIVVVHGRQIVVDQ